MPAVAAMRGSVHSSCGAWCIATSVRASRASDSPASTVADAGCIRVVDHPAQDLDQRHLEQAVGQQP